MADKFKSIAKKGWHPERDRAANSSSGQSESRLGSRVGGMLGRGGEKDSHAAQARNHQSAPLSTLKDPAEFAPPPKRLDYSKDATSTVRTRPTPPASRPTAAAPTPSASTATKPKPSLPPRLPPRQNSFPNEHTPPPPPTYNEATQQEATPQASLHRLGQAGVSVPGFGIGRNASPPLPPRQNTGNGTKQPLSSAAPTEGGNHHTGELQSRLGKWSAPWSGGEAPTTGTSWADKQAALRTASNLREDPSKVSTSDLKGAASTASNFQQRHGAQVASGWKAANGLNSKYGLTGKVNSLASSSTAAAAGQGQPSPVQSAATAGNAGGIGKKPPPPPPPKKKELGGGPVEPPPIPMGSKPKV